MNATENRKLEVVGITGPISKKPSGKFKSNGDPIMVRCTPYWVVRVVHGTVLHAHKQYSLEAANAFSESIRNGTIVEEWNSGSGFVLSCK